MATTRKTAASKVTTASFNPSTEAVKRAIAATKANVTGKSTGIRPQRDIAASKRKVAAKPSKELGEALKTIAKVPAPKKAAKVVSFAADAKGVPGKSAKVVAKKVALPKVDKRRETPQLKIGKTIIERPLRKKSDAFDSTPTISVKNGADTIKVFSKLPKGFSWLTDLGSSTRDTLMVFNKHGVHIADVRIERK